tara:strand:- start:940 stop:1191 length:252 start_codon:yes stop_codon:yes gene_type:complete
MNVDAIVHAVSTETMQKRNQEISKPAKSKQFIWNINHSRENQEVDHFKLHFEYYSQANNVKDIAYTLGKCLCLFDTYCFKIGR